MSSHCSVCSHHQLQPAEELRSVGQTGEQEFPALGQTPALPKSPQVLGEACVEVAGRGPCGSAHRTSAGQQDPPVTVRSSRWEGFLCPFWAEEVLGKKSTRKEQEALRICGVLLSRMTLVEKLSCFKSLLITSTF